jgi:hypothetical protein
VLPCLKQDQSGHNERRNTLHTQVKRKIAIAFAMGMITTGIVSFALIALNVGFSQQFIVVWLISWGVGYVVVIPAILVLGPRLQTFVERLIP